MVSAWHAVRYMYMQELALAVQMNSVGHGNRPWKMNEGLRNILSRAECNASLRSLHDRVLPSAPLWLRRRGPCRRHTAARRERYGPRSTVPTPSMLVANRGSLRRR
jgi:hypothetical protein